MKPRPAEPYWPTVLIDWCVIQALGKAGWPEQLGKRGDLQAAFVSEVSRYVKFRVLDLREAQVEALMRATVGRPARRPIVAGLIPCRRTRP